MTKLQKVVPKGAQRKFSAQKSFIRECRAKYRRNISEARKVNTNTAEIEGEEVQKTFLRGCRTYTEK
jgi:predicted Ser/Thr protein kinase